MPVNKFGVHNKLLREGERGDGVSVSFVNNSFIRTDGANEMIGSLDMGGNKIKNLENPTEEDDAANKYYVDNIRGSGFIEANQDGTFSAKGSLSFQEKYKLTNLPLPVEDDDAVTRAYADSADANLKCVQERENAFTNRGNYYQAKNVIDMRGNKIKRVGELSKDDDATSLKYVTDLIDSKTAFEKGNGVF